MTNLNVFILKPRTCDFGKKTLVYFKLAARSACFHSPKSVFTCKIEFDHDGQLI